MGSTTEQEKEQESCCSFETGKTCCAGPNMSRAILGGFAGTVTITMMMYLVAPMMGLNMDIAQMLGSLLGDSWWAGMAVHFVNGTIIFPMIYALFLFALLPRGPAVKGITWGLVLWLLAQTMVMPMMGAGFFSANIGGVMAAMGSLMGHLLYGGLLGLIAGSPR